MFSSQGVRKIIFIKYSEEKYAKWERKNELRIYKLAKYISFKASRIIDIPESRETLSGNITNVQTERYNTNDRTRTQFGTVRARA